MSETSTQSMKQFEASFINQIKRILANERSDDWKAARIWNILLEFEFPKNQRPEIYWNIFEVFEKNEKFESKRTYDIIKKVTSFLNSN